MLIVASSSSTIDAYTVEGLDAMRRLEEYFYDSWVAASDSLDAMVRRDAHAAIACARIAAEIRLGV
jgi:hypothetical protein